MQNQIAIIDFGSQFTQLIARALRESKCYCQIYYPEAFDISEDVKGVILSGSHRSSNDYGKYQKLLKSIFESQLHSLPVLGVCYGKQLVCDFFGAKIASGKSAEYGKADLLLQSESPILQNIKSKNFTVWMSHGDSVDSLPKGFESCASTKDCKFAIVQNKEKRIYCTQFHPEVTHTKNGKKILQNFIEICDLKDSWSLDSFSSIENTRLIEKVGDSNVIAAVSGGVDSTVAAKFLHSAIKDKIKCIFVDTGLLRKDEAKDVQRNFKMLGVPLKSVDASSIFFDKLKDIEDPELKRKIIGNLFIEIFEREARKLKNAKFLLQGTLYPDVVESGKKASDKIKSHHNVGGLPEKMNLELIEPFKLLFKDEVRSIGRILGIDEDLLMRHPFPGPGLAVRLPGAIAKERVKILQEVDQIYISTIKEMGFYQKIWQAFAILLPTKSVGVVGDKRRYGNVCVLRAVNSSDGMTANAYPFCDSEESKLEFLNFLEEVATRITNKVQNISRVLYDITSKPPATIEWE